MMEHKVVLARHTETIWNEQLRYIGRTDLDLSELGRSHAALMAEYLREQPLAAVFSSNMARATQTAEMIAVGRKAEIIIEPGLREIDFGNWEGLTFAEIGSAYPTLADSWIEDPYSVQIPGGESMGAFTSRVRNAWVTTRRLILENGSPSEHGRTVVVTHAGCIKVILGEIMGLSDRKVWGIHQEKGALNHIELSGTSARIIEINDRSYRKNI